MSRNVLELEGIDVDRASDPRHSDDAWEERGKRWCMGEWAAVKCP